MSESTSDRGISRRSFVRGSVATGALALPVVMAACGDDAADATGDGGATAEEAAADGAAVRGGRLRVAFADGGPDETLSPLLLPTFMGTARSQNLFDRLFQFDADVVPQPQLALEATANDDATVWTIRLREGVVWHDGDPFTAQDVVYTINWIADEAKGAEFFSTFSVIDLENTRAVDDLTVEIVFNQPYGETLNLLAGKAFFVIKDGTTEFSSESLVGTGPFRLVSFEPGGSTVVARNEDYFIEGKPYLDEIEFLNIPDSAARLNALRGGQVDAIAFVDFSQAQGIDDDPDLQLVRAVGSTCVPITMRVDEGQFADSRVREAMKLAVDRQAMVDQVLLGFGSVGNDLFGISFPSYNDELPQRQYDPEAARALLEEAGVTLPLQVTLPTSRVVAGMQESATLFREQAAAAGIEVTLEVIEDSSYFANDLYLNAELYQSTWGGSFEGLVPDAFLDAGTFNETKWNRPEWEEQFLTAQGIADADERNAAYQELQQEIWEEGGYIIWGFQELLDAAGPSVRGIVPNPQFNLGHFVFADVWLEQ